MSWRTRVAGLWRLMHPGPSLLTALAFALCAELAARGRPDPAKFAVACLGLVSMQFSISALNDYQDRAADAFSSRKRKPIVAGVVAPGVALGIALFLAVVMVACFAVFGLTAELLALLFLGLGFAYDLGVKATPFSGVMHGLAFPTLPLLAWAIFARLRPELLIAFPLGFALGIGLHLADALPDVEADTAAGLRGLTQALGGQATAVCWGAFAAASTVLIILAVTKIPGGGVAPFILAGAAALALALLLTATRIARRLNWPPEQRWRGHFQWLAAAALVLIAGWLTAISL